MLVACANRNYSGSVGQPPDQPKVTPPHRPTRTITNDDLDPRWEWIEVPEFGKREPARVKGRCLHKEMIPIDSLDGEFIAVHCLTCQQTFYRGSAA